MSATQPIKNKNDLTRFRNYYKEEELKPRNYALIVMGLNSALRIGDILSLRWEDVRRESAYRRHIWIREQKTGKDNMFPVNPMMVEALEFYRHYLTGYSSEKYIFESQKDRENPISRFPGISYNKKGSRSVWPAGTHQLPFVTKNLRLLCLETGNTTSSSNEYL